MKSIVIANIFSQGVSVGLQLLSLPIFLQYWSISQYGTWILLSTIPSYFSLADFGVAAAAANNMTASQSRRLARETSLWYSAALFFVLASTSAIGISVLLIVNLVDISNIASIFNLNLPSGTDFELTIICLSLWTLLSVIATVPNTILQCTDRTSIAIYITNATRILEFIVTVGALATYGTYEAIAISLCVARIIGIATSVKIGKAKKHSIRLIFNRETSKFLFSLTNPSVGFLIFPMQQAMTFQGYSMIVGIYFGAAELVIFNTYRTISRITVQATSILANSAMPQFAAFGTSGDKSAIWQTYHQLKRQSDKINAISCVFVLIFFGQIIEVWGKSKVPMNVNLAFIFMAQAFFAGKQALPRALLLATNSHTKTMTKQLITTAIATLVLWVAAKYSNIIEVPAVSYLLLDIILLQLTTSATQKILSTRKQ